MFYYFSKHENQSEIFIPGHHSVDVVVFNFCVRILFGQEFFRQKKYASSKKDCNAKKYFHFRSLGVLISFIITDCR